MIEDTLFYKIRKVNRLLRDSLISRLVEEGLKPSYAMTTYFISTHKDVTQSDICHFTGLKAPTISLLIKDMERDDILKRTVSTIDSRSVIVTLTDKGYELSKRYYDIYMEVNQNFTKGLNNEDKISIEYVLNKLSKCLEDEGDNK